jgi:hypothetical protein
MNLESIKKVVLNVYNAYYREKTFQKYKKNVQIKKLTAGQKKEIREYYKENFGISVNPKFHELLYSISGVYKKEYMPLDVIAHVEESLSPFKYAKILDDKAMYDWWFPGIRFPERIAICCNGVAYAYDSDKSMRPINKQQLMDLSLNLSDCFIKPSRDSSGGVGVKAFNVVDGVVSETGEPVNKLLDSYHGNYVIEKKIVNSKNLRDLNPTSCNTLRVITWRNRKIGKIELVSALLRIGRMGALIDNSAAGGITVPVGKDGILSNSGCIKKGSYKRVEKTETGIDLKGYKIDHFQEIVNTALRCHEYLPYFDFIGWDITVDDKENVIVIEYNPQPDIRLGQLTFLDSYLLDKQKEILTSVYSARK